MIKNLLMLVVIALIGWVAYVSFFGDDDDKELRNKLFSTGKEFFSAIGDIASNEQEKFKAGAYDDTLDKLSNLIDDLKKTDENGDLSDRIKSLEDEKRRLEALIQKAEEGPKGRSLTEDKTQEEIKASMDKIKKEVDDLLKEVEKKE